jgi:hypothetical protein
VKGIAAAALVANSGDPAAALVELLNLALQQEANGGLCAHQPVCLSFWLLL